MKKPGIFLWGVIGVGAVVTVLSLSVNSQSFTPSNDQVCFYENENYGGAYICLNKSGEYPNLGLYYVGSTNKSWNDKISSVIIGKNACAIMYEHTNSGGYCLILRGNGSGTRKIPKLSPYNFNDKASHIKSVAYPDNLPPEPSFDEVIFFEHSNFDGYALRLGVDFDVPDLRRYTMTDPFDNQSSYTWNDRISSVKVGSDSCVTTWININYGGQKWMYRANGNNTWNIVNLGPLGAGDRWSSLKIRDRDHCIY
jgi:hypothetical protein